MFSVQSGWNRYQRPVHTYSYQGKRMLSLTRHKWSSLERQLGSDDIFSYSPLHIVLYHTRAATNLHYTFVSLVSIITLILQISNIFPLSCQWFLPSSTLVNNHNFTAWPSALQSSVSVTWSLSQTTPLFLIQKASSHACAGRVCNQIRNNLFITLKITLFMNKFTLSEPGKPTDVSVLCRAELNQKHTQSKIFVRICSDTWAHSSGISILT